MSVKIISGATADELTIGPTSKAARVTLYEDDAALSDPWTEGYVVPIEVIPATTLVDGTTYWSMRNTGTKTVALRRIELALGFTGTAAASRSLFRLWRFDTATPTGGTLMTPVKTKTTYAASSVGDARFLATGLTTTGVNFIDAFCVAGCANQLTADKSQDLSFMDGRPGRLILAVGEGICIRAYGTVVLGCYLIGNVSWDEKP